MSKENTNAEVLVAHAIDTEGPLITSLFKRSSRRLREIFSISDVEATQANYQKLCKGELDLGGLENKIKETLSGHLVNYHEHWGQLDKMHDVLFSESFRKKYPR